MSQENVEIVSALQPAPGVDLAQLFRDDLLWAAVSATLAPSLAPDFECVARGVPIGEETVYEGLLGLRALWLEWLAPWRTYRTEVEEIVDLGERVVVLVRDFARHEENAHEVEQTAAAVWTVQDGKVIRADFYANRAEAIKAVGLEE
ncbi:MAG TPA: nuclear transport factor 2 family protein [Solirubrobacteraceae bacterium]|nr:nuclear transport factor 2 family protein [Solirubrobacteraceae bacterium]HME03316.1 nuclear transport factor 2 family protein [Solirubrobacteraceae bacterium]